MKQPGYICCHYGRDRGTQWRSWLGQCATNLKVAVSIPEGVIELVLPAAL
jgi:hypothetical protein